MLREKVLIHSVMAPCFWPFLYSSLPSTVSQKRRHGIRYRTIDHPTSTFDEYAWDRPLSTHFEVWPLLT